MITRFLIIVFLTVALCHGLDSALQMFDYEGLQFPAQKGEDHDETTF